MLRRGRREDRYRLTPLAGNAVLGVPAERPTHGSIIRADASPRDVGGRDASCVGRLSDARVRRGADAAYTRPVPHCHRCRYVIR